MRISGKNIGNGLPPRDIDLAVRIKPLAFSAAGRSKKIATIEIAGQEVALCNGVKFLLGSNKRSDDIVVNDPGIDQGHLGFFVRDGSVEVCHYSTREWTTVTDIEIGVKRILGGYASNCTVARDSLVTIPLPDGKKLEFKIIFGDHPPQKALAPYQKEDREQLAAIERHLRWNVVREFQQAKDPLQALSIYYEQLDLETRQEQEMEQKWGRFGTTALLSGLSFGTATLIGSIFEIVATSVAKSFVPFGLVTSFLTALGIVTKIINPHQSPLRMMEIRDRLQCELIECLSNFTDREVAEVLSRFNDDIRVQLMDVIDKNSPMRYMAIGHELNQLLLASPEEYPVLPPTSKPRNG